MKRFFTGIIASIVVAAAFTGCNEVKKENYVTYSTSDSSSVQQNSNDNTDTDAFSELKQRLADEQNYKLTT